MSLSSLKTPVSAFVTLCALHAVVAAQSPFEGSWRGAIAVPGLRLDVELLLESQDDTLGGIYSIPVQGIDDYPLEGIAVADRSISFTLGGGVPGNPTFELSIAGHDTLTGTFTQSGQTLDVEFVRQVVEQTNRPHTWDEKRHAIDSLVAHARTEFNVPGIGLGVVDKGTTRIAKGYGARDVEGDLPVTGSTLFAIGSTTKAFTATLVGMLVDEGRVKWDEPVRTYIPEFRMQDQYASDHLTVKDLLTHMSGLPRHDALWYNTSKSREELLAALAHVEPTEEIRQKWQYQNLMFMVAGILIERVTGKPWESFLQERILDALSMERTSLHVDELASIRDVALPYTDREGSLERMPYRTIDAVGPAGSINSSPEEMCRWLSFNLGEGRWRDSSLISAATLDYIHSPQVVMTPAYDPSSPMSFQLYGLGWMVSEYRGHRIVHHGGGIDGFVSHVVLFPDDGLGIVVLTNSMTGFPQAAALDIADVLLELEPEENLAKAHAQSDRMQSMMVSQQGLSDIDRVEGTTPRFALSKYAGTYRDEGYGELKIEYRDGRLHATYGNGRYALQHYHYDVFRADSLTGVGSSMLISFTSGPAGQVNGLDVPMEPAVAPVHFVRLPDRELRDPQFLQRLAGTFELMNQTAEVTLRDSTLSVRLPHQPEYTLVGKSLEEGGFAEFEIEELAGYRVRFVAQGDEWPKLYFIQPNGTYEAVRQ